MNRETLNKLLIVPLIKKRIKEITDFNQDIRKLTNYGELTEKVTLELENQLVKNMFIGFIAELIILFATYYILDKYTINFHYIIPFWLLNHVLNIFFRLIWCARYTTNYTQAHPNRWANIYTLGMLHMGLSWGCAGSLLMPPEHAQAQIFMALILYGVASGSLPFIAPLFKAYFLQVLAITSPFIVWLLLQGGELFLFGLLMPLWVSVVLITAYYLRHLLIKSLYLQFLNDDLLAEANQARNNLELANHDLKNEIRSRKRAERKLANLATHDPLTGLPNRALFNQYLRESCEKSAKLHKMTALLFLDLDGFKPINDQLGHAVGDQMLVAVAHKLRNRIRSTDMVARLGGDEFTLVLTDVESPASVIQVAQNIVKALSERFVLGQHKDVFVAASIGISLYPHDTANVETLIEYADAAMYRSKEAGGNTFTFHHDPHVAELASET